MASTPPRDEAFLREVDEELRRDQFTGFWRRYGRWVAIAVAVGLAALAGYLWWDHDRKQRAGVEGERLALALADLEANQADAARGKLAPLAGSENTGYKVAAKLALADLALQKGDNRAAAGQFGALATDTDLPEPYRQVALIRQTAAEYDTLKPETVVARLKPLAVAGGPWFGSAGEMTAIAYIRMNRPELASATLTAMAADEGVPETIRSRSVQLAGLLGGATTPGKQ